MSQAFHIEIVGSPLALCFSVSDRVSQIGANTAPHNSTKHEGGREDLRCSQDKLWVGVVLLACTSEVHQ